MSARRSRCPIGGDGRAAAHREGARAIVLGGARVVVECGGIGAAGHGEDATLVERGRRVVVGSSGHAAPVHVVEARAIVLVGGGTPLSLA